jgi:hypothetical protein
MAACTPDEDEPLPRLSTHRNSSCDRGLQIAAAKLRVATDRRIGETKPDGTKERAAQKPALTPRQGSYYVTAAARGSGRTRSDSGGFFHGHPSPVTSPAPRIAAVVHHAQS